MMAGFPDSFLTEREAAEVTVMTAYNCFSLTLAAVFAALAVAARGRDVRRPFVVACTAWALAIVAVAGLEARFAATLMDGGGG